MKFNLSNCQFDGIATNIVRYIPTKEALSQFIEKTPDFLFCDGKKRRDFQHGEVHLLILDERYIKTIVYIFYDNTNKLSDRSKYEKIYVYKEVDKELIYNFKRENPRL